MGIARTFPKSSHLEKRRSARTRVVLKGRLFFPDSDKEEACDVLDLSPAGAGLKSTTLAANGTRLVLYVDGFGRFEGSFVRRDRARLGIAFNPSPARRARTAEQIATFVSNGMKVGGGMRRTARISPTQEIRELVTEAGTRLPCEIVDIAMGGAALRSPTAPPVGETVYFGETVGKVLRHTADGFVIGFFTPSDQR